LTDARASAEVQVRFPGHSTWDLRLTKGGDTGTSFPLGASVFLSHSTIAPYPYFICHSRYVILARTLFEKLTVPQLVQQFPSFCAARRFVNIFTCTRHLSLILRQLNPIHASHPISRRSMLILSFHLRLGLSDGSFPKVSYQNPQHTTC